MENINNIVENLGESLLSIEREQSKICEQVIKVENKRHYILAYITNLKMVNNNAMLDKKKEQFEKLEIKIMKKEENLNNHRDDFFSKY